MLADEIAELKRSMVFVMSLGSKELFHSNIWAWLIEQDIAFADVFFDGLSMNKTIRVTREEKHRDITIWVGEDAKTAKAYVIENKFKSIPHAEQLERYKSRLGKRFWEGLVTGIEAPSWECDGWKFVDFSTINDRIEKVARNSQQLDAFSKELTLRYCRTVRSLTNVLNAFIESNGNRLVSTKERSYLEPIRIADIAGKLQGERFAKYLRLDRDLRQIKSDVEALGFHFLIRSDFFKKHVVIDVRVVADNSSADETKDHGTNTQWMIGIQIEDGSYARCAQVGAEVRHNGQRLNRESVFDFFNKQGWLPEKTQLPGEPLMRKPESAYGTYQKQGSYCFVYQPYRLEVFDFGALKDRIVNDMRSAVDVVKKIAKKQSVILKMNTNTKGEK